MIISKAEAIQVWKLFFSKYNYASKYRLTDAEAVIAHLLNGKQFKELTDHQLFQQQVLKTAIDTGDFKHPIFKDDAIIPLTVALLASKNQELCISEQQAFSVLERNQIIKDYPLENTYQILAPDGSFTNEALTQLLPALAQSKLSEFVTREQIEEFRLLVSCLPLSEQTFYTTALGSVIENGTLGKIIYEAGGIYLHKNSLVHLAAGARDAHGIARFGLENYVRPMSVLGKLEREDIETGLREGIRPATLYLPGHPYYKKIHDHTSFTPMEAWYHDYYHALLMSLLPRKLRLALEYMVDLLRNTLGVKWTKCIWTLIDAELAYLLNSNDANHARLGARENEFDVELDLPITQIPFSYLSKHALGDKLNELNAYETSDLFYRILSFGRAHIDFAAKGSYLFLANKEITAEGILIMIDMIKNQETWKKFNILPPIITYSLDPNCELPYKTCYEQITKLYPLIKNDDPKMQVLKCKVFFTMMGTGMEKRVEAIFNYFYANKATIMADLAFQKVTNKDLEANESLCKEIFSGKDKIVPFEIANMTFLCLDGNILTDEKIKKFSKEWFFAGLYQDLHPINIAVDLPPTLAKATKNTGEIKPSTISKMDVCTGFTEVTSSSNLKVEKEDDNSQSTLNLYNSFHQSITQSQLEPQNRNSSLYFASKATMHPGFHLPFFATTPVPERSEKMDVESTRSEGNRPITTTPLTTTQILFLNPNPPASDFTASEQEIEDLEENQKENSSSLKKRKYTQKD